MREHTSKQMLEAEQNRTLYHPAGRVLAGFTIDGQINQSG